MSLIKASANFEKVKDEELARFVEIYCDDVTAVVNGGLDFQTNFNAKIVSAVFSSANTTVGVSHGLGRVPSGYIVVGLSAAMTVFNGSGSNTTSVIYLQASAAGSASLLIF